MENTEPNILIQGIPQTEKKNDTSIGVHMG